MWKEPGFSTAARIAGCALVLIGAASGCSEHQEPTAARLDSAQLAATTAPVCDGELNCTLPNPSPCEAAGAASTNFLTHPNDPADCTFEIRPQTVLHGGLGTPRGAITDAQVRIVYGQRKLLPDGRVNPADGLPQPTHAPESAVYVSNVNTADGVASGWIYESDLRESVAFMPTVAATDPGEGDYQTTWRFTGGTPEARAGYEGMVFRDGHTPNDYLLRPGGAMDMLYNLPGAGGASDETYLLDHQAVFHRSKGVKVVYVPYYHAGDAEGSSPAGTMGFMYGHVGDRYGWVSRDGAETTTDCQGAYSCKLPNTEYRCTASGGGGSNRVSHPGNSDDCTFTIAPGTILYDGMGTARSTVTSTQVRINYGQRKQLPDGTTVVYVWDATTTDGHASGWIPESDVTEDLSFMETVNDADPGQGDYPRAIKLTGGSAQLRAYYDQMVFCEDERPCGPVPNHYMLRPGNVVNVLYSLPGSGGVSNDTYLVDGRAVTFHRARGVPLLSIPYYDKDTPAGSPAVGEMAFMYGHVGDRYGWVAVDATNAGSTHVP
ncbi:MAG TPA: hypothetical protein VFL93_00680 [Longimicrobiaceae bacterium]|nr:hypothetical protein [Longimicrobiaceae bacterium]